MLESTGWCMERYVEFKIVFDFTTYLPLFAQRDSFYH